jgi:hypothetical protein
MDREESLRLISTCIFVLLIGSAVNGAQAAPETKGRQAAQAEAGRWCSISSSNNSRNCYFKRHQDCMKAISDGSGVCVPNEANRGAMPEDPENNSK